MNSTKKVDAYSYRGSTYPTRGKAYAAAVQHLLDPEAESLLRGEPVIAKAKALHGLLGQFLYPVREGESNGSE